jgi:hypothetical protein
MSGAEVGRAVHELDTRQTLDTFRVHCRGLIPDGDIDNIIGRTAARLLGLERAS